MNLNILLISLHFANRDENTVVVNYKAAVPTVERRIFAGASVPVKTLSPQSTIDSCQHLLVEVTL